MFIAMNRFRVQRGQEEAFERVWLDRETFLKGVPGFQRFNLLRGPMADDHTLYASHSTWASRDQFEAWTRSEAFRSAHGSTGAQRDIYLGHPQLETFDVIQTVS